MPRRIAASWLIASLVLAVPALASAQEKRPEDAQKAEAAVKADLAKRKGDYAQLLFKDEPALKKALPDYRFIVAR